MCISNIKFPNFVSLLRSIGKLNVKVDGPHKADIKLSLCDEGYKVR